MADRYRLVRVVGEGGMGTVYEAEHLDLARPVALKLMHPRMDAGEQARQRFEREARAAAATGHENVVDIFDLGRDERGVPYLVMELLKGVDLGRAIHHVGRLPARRSAWIVGQVLLALEAVHAVGIHHRDLKPDNVFLTKRAGIPDWVKVLDFGVAEFTGVGRAAQGRPTGPRKVAAGTLHYMAPEQASGDADQDERVDVYAAGALLYECLTGELPFEAASPGALRHKVIANAYNPVEVLSPEVDPRLCAVVSQAMARVPHDRHPSARALFDALRPFGAGSPPSPPHLTPARGVSRTVRARYSAGSTRSAQAMTAPASEYSARVEAPGHPTGSQAFAPRPQRMADVPHVFRRSHADAAPLEVRDDPPLQARPELLPPRSGAHPTLSPRAAALRLRGRWVLRVSRGIEERQGAEVYAGLVKGLSDSARTLFSGVLLPTAWVDARDLDELLIATKIGTTARQLGRTAAETTFPAGSAMPPRDPHDWTPTLAQWIAGAAPELTPLSGGLLRVSVDHAEHGGSVVSGAIAGLLEAFATRAGVDVVAVSHTANRGHGIASLTIRTRN